MVNRTSRYHRSSGLEEHQLTRPQPSRGLETISLASQQQPSISTAGAPSSSLGGGVGSGQTGSDGNRRLQTGTSLPSCCIGFQGNTAEQPFTCPSLVAPEMLLDDNLKRSPSRGEHAILKSISIACFEGILDIH